MTEEVIRPHTRDDTLSENRTNMAKFVPITVFPTSELGMWHGASTASDDFFVQVKGREELEEESPSADNKEFLCRLNM